LSRQAATEAIKKYNRHIEQCNRVIEASEAGDARPGWGETQVDSLKEELRRVAGQLEVTAQDRNKLQEELRQKSLIVSDLSTRLDALSKKVNSRETPAVVLASQCYPPDCLFVSWRSLLIEVQKNELGECVFPEGQAHFSSFRGRVLELLKVFSSFGRASSHAGLNSTPVADACRRYSSQNS